LAIAMVKGKTIQKQKEQEQDDLIITARLKVSKAGYKRLLSFVGNDEELAMRMMGSYLNGLWDNTDPASFGYDSLYVRDMINWAKKELAKRSKRA
jgi:hypothetical protein